MSSQPDLDDRIRTYYATQFDEDARLTGRSAAGRVELLRTRALLARALAPRSVVLDVGGGTGVHAAWLAAEGHDVTLVDAVPEHVAAAAALGGFAAEVGDARALRAADSCADAVLLLGPLYHLRARSDRVAALREARRVLRPGGLVVAGAITRTVATLDLLLSARFTELPGEALVRLLADGDVPEGHGFPAGHVHTADELADELAAAAFSDVDVTGVEGPASFGLELVRPATDEVVEAALVLAEHAQDHPAAPDLSGHLLATGRRG